MKALLFLTFLLLQSQAPATIQTGGVSGRLLSKNGTPAVNVRIAAMPASDDKRAAPVLVSLSQTDESGSYHLADIPPGRYYVVAGLIDYPNYFPGTSSLDEATLVTVAAGANTNGIDFVLARSAGVKISGRVTAPPSVLKGAGRTITLTPRTRNVAGRATSTMSASADAEGAFFFSPVLPGEYQLTSLERGSSTISLTVFDDDISDVQLPVADCNSGVQVRGRLAGTPSAPVERISLTGARFRCSSATLVNADGSFVFSDIPADSYSVRLTPTPLGWSTANFVVETRDVTDLEVPLPVAVVIKGRVTVEGGEALPRLARGAPIAIQAGTPMGDSVAKSAVEDDGSFALRLTAGQYRISLPSLPPNYRVKSITSSDFTDLMRLPLNVNEDGTGIRVTLGLDSRTPEGVRVSGRIIPSAGGALPKPEGVLLVRSSSGRNAPVLTTEVAPDGSFTFSEVAPGLYDLQTFPDSPVALRDINVGRTEVAGLEIKMPVLFKVHGAIEWIDTRERTTTHAPQTYSVQFLKRARTRVDSELFVWAALAQSDSFQLYLPEGDYRFSITGVSEDAVITSARFGSLDLLETDLPVRSSLDPMNVRVTLRQ